MSTTEKSSFVKAGQVPLLLYDGYCALCNGMVRRIIRRDKRRQFYFAPLDSRVGREIQARFPDILTHVDSLVLFDGQTVYIKSEAVLRGLKYLPGPSRIFRFAYFLPKPFRNWIYDGIARVRYRWFGRYDVCPLPPPEWRDRFLF